MPKARAWNGNLEDKELRLGLDPELELLCMLSPLQIIYALKAQKTKTSLLKVDKFDKGWASHERHSK